MSITMTTDAIEGVRKQLDRAHFAIERLDRMIHVSVAALYGQDCDIDSAVATCLEAAVTAELEPARKSIEDALELLPEVANG